jgi:hypothetical protein
MHEAPANALVDIPPHGAYRKIKVFRKAKSGNGKAFNLKQVEKPMEIYIPNFQLKEVSDVLAQEGVTFEITDKTFSLVMGGKESYEVTEVRAELLETEVPAIFDQDEPRRLRAFRLPSGKKILLTDADGNFDRLVQAPPGWER